MRLLSCVRVGPVVSLLAACPASPGSSDGTSSSGVDTSSAAETASSESGASPTSSSGVVATDTSTGGASLTSVGSSGESESGSTDTSSSGPVDTSSGSSDPPSTTGGPGAPIVVENPGFEADGVADGAYNDKIVPAGWTKYDPLNIIGLDYNSLGVLNPTGTVLYPDDAPEGKNVALVEKAQFPGGAFQLDRITGQQGHMIATQHTGAGQRQSQTG